MDFNIFNFIRFLKLLIIAQKSRLFEYVLKITLLSRPYMLSRGFRSPITFSRVNPTVGNLIYIRTKSCQDLFLNERELCGDSHDETEEKNCEEKNNCGHWSNWSEWIDSSDVQQSRQRACLHAKIGEPTCFGPSTMSRQVSPWTSWKFTPEVSEIYRQREICDETGCKENNFIQRDEKHCENSTCPVWSKWGPWKSLAPSKPVYKRERVCE